MAGVITGHGVPPLNKGVFMNACEKNKETIRLELGVIVSTRGVNDYIQKGIINPFRLLKRHQSGDWGNVCAEDWATNDDAIKNGDRIISSYTVNSDEEPKVWIITEWDRSATTLLFPHEY